MWKKTAKPLLINKNNEIQDLKMPEGTYECVLGHIYSAIIQINGIFPKKVWSNYILQRVIFFLSFGNNY